MSNNSNKDNPVLTPEVCKALSTFQKSHAWAFDEQLQEIKDFIITYYPDEKSGASYDYTRKHSIDAKRIEVTTT